MLISLRKLFLIVINVPNKGFIDSLMIKVVSKKRFTDSQQLFDYEMYKSQRDKKAVKEQNLFS